MASTGTGHDACAEPAVNPVSKMAVTRTLRKNRIRPPFFDLKTVESPKGFRRYVEALPNEGTAQFVGFLGMSISVERHSALDRMICGAVVERSDRIENKKAAEAAFVA
jgi:hypothetical protein